MCKKVKHEKTDEGEPSTTLTRELEEEDEEEPFEEEIQRLREAIAYMKRELRTEPKHIKIPD